MCRMPLGGKNGLRVILVQKCIQSIKKKEEKKCCTWKTLGHDCKAHPSSSLERMTRVVNRLNVIVVTVQNQGFSYLICVIWTWHKEKQPCKWVSAWHRIALTPWTWAKFGNNWMHLNITFHKIGIEMILPFPLRPLRVRCVKKLPISHIWWSRHFSVTRLFAADFCWFSACPYTLWVKTLHTSSHSMFFLEFYYCLHSRYVLRT